MIIIFLSFIYFGTAQTMYEFDSDALATKDEMIDIIQKSATYIAKSYPVQEIIKKLFNDSVIEIKQKYIYGSYKKLTNVEHEAFMNITKEINETLIRKPEVAEQFSTELVYDIIKLRNGVHKDSETAKYEATFSPQTYQLNETSSEDAKGQFKLFERKVYEFNTKIKEVEDLNKTAMISFYDGRYALNQLRKKTEQSFTNGQKIEARTAKTTLMKAESKLSNAETAKSAYDAVIEGIKMMCDEIQRKVDEIIQKFSPYYKELLIKCLTPKYRYKTRQEVGLFTNMTLYNTEMTELEKECHFLPINQTQRELDYQWVIESNVNKTQILWS
ncbi:hypothetical protein EHI8A_001900 [Entamoeba histolytica HM-1:IMSS-B]|uniref:Uncharacterized protein n=6 Tax=Entamoeba histolytica TaxID=5759 RepID=B1N2K3_ENTH1|nr:hypothetical protein EHI_110220 [Entamoeba histolytica HM-1:IMSS]EMD46403.1 Hypothetical protein EHI5A_013820 [Entamoeba histolytica KU27]EMH75879.1 hypothetical protein EHI8A_001900 [Entamoeba histolytica HM-1:IMSS-B]EMS16610.1 hypothetical protein KM1_015100 [Entamoeba histolytica HM-3:IMSS]ENY62691.1 hypothetical protein EHI7A_004090 [Entamoeba histolytica HM-1:IMSS-A]GAT92148.1 hypothetical protein CL6EHI_110220 [Entamoeba histolytica]|eukprot:XP_001913419.1 hypothetical protein EHI_110220 [Entamoeba histolytica HM-1:IMSS]